ncbi:MAG: hypothetical protein HQK77_18445, partial [Desulfobacterales bacterium]|nr:hypothetical protein [Desulfobacterales bacterium]
MRRFADISLRNKFFFSIMGAILTLTIAIAFLSRWILITTLTGALKERGIAISHDIAEKSKEYLLKHDSATLSNLIVTEAKLSNRKEIIAYIIILDATDKIVCHTFSQQSFNLEYLLYLITVGKNLRTRTIKHDNEFIFDVTSPIHHEASQLGVVHLGLKQEHINVIITQIEFILIGFILISCLIIFFISRWFARYFDQSILQVEKQEQLVRGNKINA